MQFQETASKFAREKVLPAAPKIDSLDLYDRGIMSEAGQLGFFGIAYGEEAGGLGLGIYPWTRVVAEISKASASVGLNMNVQGCLAARAIEVFGSEAQKQKFLAPLLSADKIGAFGLTESGSGSDAFSLSSYVVDKGTHLELHGGKNFITQATEMDVLAVFARMGQGGPLTGFLLEVTPENRGDIIVRKEEKLGMHGTGTAQLAFDGIQIPKENIIGGVGQGKDILNAILYDGRITIAAVGEGVQAASLEASLAYAEQRTQFRKPIIEFHAIQQKLAEMKLNYDLTKLMIWHASEVRDRGDDFAVEASAAKLFSSEAAVSAALDAIQIHGGYGYINEYPTGRFLRDAKLLTIGEGTTEVQRMVIAKRLLSALRARAGVDVGEYFIYPVDVGELTALNDVHSAILMGESRAALSSGGRFKQKIGDILADLFVDYLGLGLLSRHMHTLGNVDEALLSLAERRATDRASAARAVFGRITDTLPETKVVSGMSEVLKNALKKE